MANIAAKLKGLNWKEFLIDHCEKIIMGSVGLFALSAVGMTRWGTYEVPPEKFAQKVQTAKNEFQNSRWPEESRKDFDARDLGDVVSRVIDGVPLGSTYSLPVRFYQPPYAKKPLMKEIKWESFREPLADASRVLLILEPEQATNEMGIAVAVADKAGENNPGGGGDGGENVDRPRVSADAPRTTTPGGATPGAAPPTPMPGRVPMPMPNTAHGEGSTPGGNDPALSGLGMATTAKVNARGYRFVAVRAVFPMKEQLDEVRRKLSLDTVEQAFSYINFQDFELERQVAVAGPNPWSQKWEKVNLDVVLDIYRRVQFDVDIVDEKYREAVFTSPLPFRVTNQWDRLVSHPLIKRLLTEDEAARQEAKNKAAIETMEKLKKQPAQKGGFGQVQHDSRGMQRMIQQSEPSAVANYNSLVNEYSGGSMPEMGSNPQAMGMGMNPGAMGMNPMAGGRQGGGAIVQIPELLLFRYLDFDVRPGNAYRYRVRLVIKNPLFQRETSELELPESANGEFRQSVWSEITKPTIVEDDMQVYLSKVNPSPAASPSGNFDAYHWMTDVGAVVKGPFEKITRGDPISAQLVEETTGKNRGTKTGGVKADVLRPAQQTYADETIEYITPFTLIDLSVTPVLASVDYPDLELGNLRTAAKLEEAVLVNQYGEIVEQDNYRQKQGYERAKTQLKQQEENFKDYRKNTATAGTPGSSGGLSGLLGPMPGAEGGSTPFMNEGGSNPGMMPPGMMPGMPGATGPGGRKTSTLKRGGSRKGGGGGGSVPMSGL